MDIRLSISLSPPEAVRRVTISVSPPPAPEPLPPPVTQLPPPPEATYSSKDQLYESIQAWAAQYHYAFRIIRSKDVQNGLRRRIVYGCDRAGAPPPENHPQGRPQARKRHRTTRKTGCQFSIIAIELSDKTWELRHREGAQYNTHNHPPSHSSTSHPAHRKLAQEDKNKAKELYKAGTEYYYITLRTILNIYRS